MAQSKSTSESNWLCVAKSKKFSWCKNRHLSCRLLLLWKMFLIFDFFFFLVQRLLIYCESYKFYLVMSEKSLKLCGIVSNCHFHNFIHLLFNSNISKFKNMIKTWKQKERSCKTFFFSNLSVLSWHFRRTVQRRRLPTFAKADLLCNQYDGLPIAWPSF